ncbi:hydroxysteroid 11-beta-dehydrogenase 1-like protein [Branchiostoma floridae]|uniref:Hydroxysteroid 11-beta-dehydrogenase 1-like protein n=1 Tax=Branchiostoma floridae TaxID=7739 RepID=A0A9J7LEW2_BRAFL|nr:hydroxysteroid 11-beta-dehydrogenase 1-like protein [Branchiostoma floridae]
MSALLRASLLVLLCAVAVGIYWNYDGFDPESVRGATVVITGCSTGIGEEMAYQYARLGAKILITARRENRLKEVVAKAVSLGAQEAHYVAGDMGKAEDCERTIQTAKEKFGRLDYLVLNHVGSNYKSLEDKFHEGKSWDQDPDMDFFEDYLNINLVSYVRLASLALPLLKESKGHIVVVNSGFVRSGRVLQLAPCGTDEGGAGRVRHSRRAGVHRDSESRSKLTGKMKSTPELLDIVTPVDQTAMSIVRGGATRAREVYYPFIMWPFTKFGALMPKLTDYLTSKIDLVPES